MGREIVYCWKCATRLQGSDFESRQAYRVGDKVSCADCVEELVADLPAEEQEAILNGPPAPTPRSGSQPVKKVTSTRVKAQQQPPGQGTASIKRSGNTSVRTRTGATGPVTKVRTGATGPVPTAGGGTGVRKRVTASIPKVQPPAEDGAEEEAEGGEKPPMDEKKKKILLLGGVGGGLFLVIVVLLVLVLTKKPPPKKATTEEAEETRKPKPVAVETESPKVKEVKALLKEAFDLKAKDPESLGPQLKKFKEAAAAAEGTALATDAEAALDDVRLRIDKAVSAVDAQVKDQWTANDFKPVFEAYEKAKALHDFPEWKEKIANKVGLAKNKMDDTFHRFKKLSEDARQSGEEAKIQECKDTIAKWGDAEYVEKFEKFLALMAAAEAPDTAKTPDAPPKAPGIPALKPLSPAIKAFMPAWQEAIAPALGRDFGAAATALGGAGARADSPEAKKAAADDAQALKDLGELYPELLKQAGQTARLTAFTLEYQDQPGVWKTVTGKTVKVDPTRIEFKPDTPKDAKELPPIFIEISDLNAGSLALLYKTKKKTLDRKEADLLARFCLLEGSPDAVPVTGGAAPDRFWHFAPDARAAAPKPNSREFEARTLFHQSEFDWRKPLTKYNAIEKSKLLINDYTSTSLVKKYQPQIAQRAETGKEFLYLPSTLAATGDANVFKLKKEDPAWVSSKDIDFKDSLYNYIEAEFIALPNASYKCWVYAGGCCQEVWNGSFQLTEATTKNKGKDVPIDPGGTMAAPLPIPTGMKKTHDDHKPKGAKPADHPKAPTRWEWIAIPMPKTFTSPGAKQIRILTDQAGFAVKYIVISSTRTKAPDEPYAKELAKEASQPAGAAPKSEVKGTPQPKDWFVIGPFDAALAKEEGPEKEIDLSKELKGKSGSVKWKPFSGAITGAQCKLDWTQNIFTPKDGVSAYAVIHVKAPQAMEARLYVGHDDGGRVWLNGSKVHENAKGTLKADEYNVALKLEEGWNRLLFKVSNNNGNFGFIMRITDGNKAPVPGLEFSPTGDLLEPQ
ncbi:MAG TPA: hypothetical protein VM222_00310 [Planctomycetota bacterium]|nr:hypothetical protein [Planctomycetota bacterium]